MNLKLVLRATLPPYFNTVFFNLFQVKEPLSSSEHRLKTTAFTKTNVIDSFQIFEEDERDFLPRKRKSEEEEELEKELANEKKRKKKKKKKKKDEDGNDDDSDENNEADDEQLELERRLEEVKKEEQRKRDEERREKNEKIDNPYLKPVRMPRCGLGGIPLITTPLKKEK